MCLLGDCPILTRKCNNLAIKPIAGKAKDLFYLTVPQAYPYDLPSTHSTQSYSSKLYHCNYPENIYFRFTFALGIISTFFKSVPGQCIVRLHAEYIITVQTSYGHVQCI